MQHIWYKKKLIDINLYVAVCIIGKVGKVKTQFEFLIKPGAPVKIWSRSTREQLVFKLCAGVFQKDPQDKRLKILLVSCDMILPDGLPQSPDVPVAQNRLL